jgi:glutaredoxin
MTNNSDVVCTDDVCFISNKNQTDYEKSDSPITVPTPESAWTIYGKNNCPFCIKAKQLLSNEQLSSSVAYHDVEKYGGANNVRQQLYQIPETHKTVPIVFYGETFIGGYTELETFYKTLKNEKINNDIYDTNTTTESKMANKYGGLSESKLVDAEVIDLVTPFQQQIVDKIIDDIDDFKIINYKTQLVAGLNYFVKIQVNRINQRCVHVRIYKPLPHTKKQPELYAHIDYPKTVEDPIVYF